MNDSFYLAPLQGFTKVWYRNAYHNAIGDESKCFTPFFEEYKQGGFTPKLFPELDSELNAGINTIPQITANGSEFLSAAYEKMSEMGYGEVNLNMGCPFPMLVKRGKGGGLMDKPQVVEKMLGEFFGSHPDAKLSVKMRGGLDDHSQGVAMAKMLNRFPVTELIVHPRLVVQQYDGVPEWDAFDQIAQISTHTLAANGDINNSDDFDRLKNRFPQIKNWMMGRGWLTNPSLAKELSGTGMTFNAKKADLKKLHDTFLTLITSRPELAWQYRHQLLVQFWHYPSQGFDNGRRWLRRLAKNKDLTAYTNYLQSTFNSLEPIE